jgi:flagellar motor switch protein FliN/FliY
VSAHAAASANGGGSAALVLAETPEETAEDSEDRDTRLDRLAMQLDVMVRVQSMRVQDLLSLENGAVVETIHEHSQDLPVRCGGALLAWAEFEVVDQKLAVRITRLA